MKAFINTSNLQSSPPSLLNHLSLHLHYISAGAIFEQGTDEVQSAFKFAVLAHNRNNVTRKFELQAYVDVINTADAFKLSRLSKNCRADFFGNFTNSSSSPYFISNYSLQPILTRSLRHAGSRFPGLLRHPTLVLQHLSNALHHAVVPREGKRTSFSLS